MVDKHGNPIRVGDAVRIVPSGREAVLDHVGDMDRRGFGDFCGHVVVVDPNDFGADETVPAYAVAGGVACYDLELVT